MAKTAVATPSVDFEAIDRLEQKLKMLVTVLDRTRAESARAADELVRTRADTPRRTKRTRRLRTELEAALRAARRGRRGRRRAHAAPHRARADSHPRRRHAPANRGPQPLGRRRPMKERRAPGDASTSTGCGIRSAATLDPAYVAELAAYVERKMQLAARESPAGDTLKIAVLAALNIADEYFRARQDGTSQRTGLPSARWSSNGCSIWRSARRNRWTRRPTLRPLPGPPVHSKIPPGFSSSLLCS